MKSLLLLATIVFGAHCKSLQPRVVNGIDADFAAFPFVVSIQSCTPNCAHKCTGSLISRRLVVTAAHCVVDTRQQLLPNLRVQAGTVKNTSGGVATNFTSVKIPADYKVVNILNLNSQNNSVLEVSERYDIAVLRLDSCFQDVNIKPIALAPSNYTAPYNLNVTVVGWGSTDAFNLKPTNVLKYGKVKVIPTINCANDVSPAINDSHHICTFGRATGLCPLDVGAPLITTAGWMIGVYTRTMQWRSFDGQEHDFCGFNPDIYTSVGATRNFIDSAYSTADQTC